MSGAMQCEFDPVDSCWNVTRGDQKVAMVKEEADARLFAAAPEMLEALRQYVAVADRAPDRECPAAVLSSARAAIAKATGGEDSGAQPQEEAPVPPPGAPEGEAERVAARPEEPEEGCARPDCVIAVKQRAGFQASADRYREQLGRANASIHRVREHNKRLAGERDLLRSMLMQLLRTKATGEEAKS